MQLYIRYYYKAIQGRHGKQDLIYTAAYILTDNISPWNYGLRVKFRPVNNPQDWDFSTLVPDKLYEEEVY